MYNYLNDLGFTTLNEVQSKIIKLSGDRNILILSPCGSGKTEAAYNVILESNHKSIFIQPMRTLATSIYNRLNTYNKILNLDSWSIQHSSIAEDKFLQNKYCVTTIDQVLSGWLGFGTQSFIRGKNVLLSNLVFDEVQLFEPDKTFLTTINMLKGINGLGNRFVIMTATMPEYLISFLQKEFDMDVIICEEDAVKDRNVKINYVDAIDFNKINVYNYKQIIICNQQSQQEFIYNNIEDKSRVIILNNKLTQSDRQNSENQVLKYFGKDSIESNKILIATQVIEAGMDISATKVYSAISPIDNLVQRAGRCVRWGGDGKFIVFNIDNNVYDRNIINDTIEKIKEFQDSNFNWDIQKQLVNEILNPYYKKYINKKSIKINIAKIGNNQRSEIIRDIRNINLIVCNSKTLQLDDFERESVSIHIDKLKNLNNNIFYKQSKNSYEEIEMNQINIGDTILIKGNDCTYDILGFRCKKDYICNSFDKVFKNNNKKVYTDYEKEHWISHTEKVKRYVNININKCNIMRYDKDKINYISHILGLHDLGKLDVGWQDWAGIKENDIPLAHFPFTKKPFLHKNRSHKHISAYILKPYIDNLLFNVILQHHGRTIQVTDKIEISKYKLHSKSLDIITEYGYKNKLSTEGNTICIYPEEVINPSKKNWNEFLYLVGILMESDIESINTYY